MTDTGRHAEQSPILAPAELAEQLSAEVPPLLLDVQWALGDPGSGRRGYLQRHLPGARFCDLDTVLAGPVRASGGRHPLPDPPRLQTELRRLGVDDESAVVVYDGGDGLGVARAWWVLRWAGVASVRILDGGLPAWLAEGGSSAAGEEPPPAPGGLTVRPGALPVLDADAAAAVARDGVLLDARARPRYLGVEEPMDPVAGHIPGARSAPVARTTDAEGRYRSPAELQRWFAERGVAADTPVGAYCGSGVSAAAEVVALRLAGIDAALYVGSWSDWVSNPSRPVATGDEEPVASPE